MQGEMPTCSVFAVVSNGLIYDFSNWAVKYDGGHKYAIQLCTRRENGTIIEEESLDLLRGFCQSRTVT